MDILYIGPYRHNQMISISSKDIINTIGGIKNVDLTIRPIYLSNNISEIDKSLLELENKSILPEYDIIVQHAPAKFLFGSRPPFTTKTKMVAIPIMKPIINKKDYAKCLTGFDMFLTDNGVVAEILKNNYDLSAQTEMFAYADSYTTEESIDLDIYSADLKFYFIGSFARNKSAIELILRSFYIAFHAISNISLILVLTDQVSDDIRKQLDDLILTTKRQLNISQSYQREKIIVKNPSIKELISIHNTCDILISLYDYEAESNINRHIALKNNNKIIDESKIRFFYDIAETKNEPYYFGESRMITNTLELSTAMRESINYNQTSYPVHKTIDQILCQ